MRTTSALAFLLAVVVPLTASLPTSNSAITRPPIQARWPILKPRFLNVTNPEDIPDDPTVPVPGKPILVPADGSVLLDERDKMPYRKSFKPRRRVKKRHLEAHQKRDQNGGLTVTIVNLDQPEVIKLSPFNGTAI
ncbi:hypothetical protein B0J13DRAFT_542119 [Dactylonectria estremocensis]|uniref:Uncharacterized protein n=1 Tax=Dactylonectria estremocensis TaxID=1079267 RepID=A0A9P9FCQ2_9HYPO|nr:hypothetical protein B0J13DRAFT_542119 [Dactylonectria estremocensis]